MSVAVNLEGLVAVPFLARFIIDVAWFNRMEVDLPLVMIFVSFCSHFLYTCSLVNSADT